MDNSKYNVHRKREFITKLVKDLGEFTSDDDIAEIVSRVIGEKVHGYDVRPIRHQANIFKPQRSMDKSRRDNACLDLYDHRKIREFLDRPENKKKIE